MKKKRVISCILAGAFVLGGQQAWAATVHYNDSSVTGKAEEWNAWVADWENVANDYTHVSLTPGAAQTELNFAWYTEGPDGSPVVYFGTDPQNLQAFNGTCNQVDASLTEGKAYSYNYVTVTGLKANTTYYYSVSKNGVLTPAEVYRSGSFDSVNILYVGDPQVGASKGQPQGEGKLTADNGAANTAARNDGFAWDRTLDIATAQNPNLNFAISAGDQVNRTGKAKEEEYAAYLSASALKSLPVATTIGNHDSLNPDYSYHFNNPNPTGMGMTQAGGDYYYLYGSGLFIMLNTNNYNVAEHEQAIKTAVESYPDASWRIVTIHQDIYGSGLDHSDTDGMILRTQLTPVFDKYDIDVVLQGHDHTYSRSKILYGDGQTHGSYEFRLDETGDDYDWDHAYNRATGQSIALAPAAEDAEGLAALEQFTNDNRCYTIESAGQSTVTDPKGTLYMTANSASGSKYYELINSQQDYIENRSQNWLPSYSIINMTSRDFKITTYQITDDGRVETIDHTFTIHKTAGR
ncbi:MAG: fibronectin type III domain-containing protein [Enterocloster sp.]